MTKELERKVEAMGESIGRVILQGMLEDAWDKGVEQERRNTEKEREHAIVAFISFGIPKEKILEKGYTEEEYTKVKKKLLFLIFMLRFSTGKLAKLTLLEQTSKFIMLKINISSVPISHSISMLMRRHNLA